ncbi:cytochrome P450 sterol C22-desaturase [Punctularia strigosozonata HHB-11173 SS5]|uniref:cytochrome P450 sterol C22-desaturase n=1 Tax=Punctularia strigosozonata (strain HHB-11173) TaxID=741275 RepID=UPI0004416597|nr:cytochrome P450 sterol C22-desaturase [Punctularia strigosozonata HHB-11173 SS5]EIN13415.1 cytochrome P450 sterol C22-desaturase [Punctularia strigosozonata HHB-11173 SS5]
MPSSTDGSAAPLYNIRIPSIFSSASETGRWFYTTLAIVAGLLILEQTVYRMRKRHLPGDNWTIPIIGKFADSMKPTMEGYKAQWDSGALSALSVFHIFIVMASSNEFSRKILNSPNHAEPCLVYSAKQILLPDNWVFLTGKSHVDYRRGLNNLFTRKALSIYVAIQDAVTRKHFNKWLAAAAADPSPKKIMMTARSLNMDTSLRVFCGPHISEEAADEINKRYWEITLALELVNFPIPLPGTKVYRAIQARKAALNHLMLAAKKSKESMAAGGEPECMLDQWVRDLQDPSYKGRKDFSDREMAMVVFSFLFASQDAMSSGLIYGFQHLADHPEIFAKVRDEQDRVRAGDYEAPLTMETLEQMPYLLAVVRESMRVKPPVTMVPYKTTKAFPISDDYTVPSGSMVIPSFYNSLHDPSIYENPEEFIPERWLDPNSSANTNPKNYLVFGSGPHRCIGEQYAVLNTALVLGSAVALMDWEHVRTPQSEEVEIIATLFPKDGCLMKFSPRKF